MLSILVLVFLSCNMHGATLRAKRGFILCATAQKVMRDGPKSYARRPRSTGGLEFAPKLLRMAPRSHLPHPRNAIRIMRE